MASSIKNKFKAFTLAEILITIGIIGIIAAITIPNLITRYQKAKVETQLKAFISIINNAARLSIVDNGDIDGWIQSEKTYSYDETEDFLMQYLLPYMKYVTLRRSDSGIGEQGAWVVLLNGSAMWIQIDHNGADILFFADGNGDHDEPNNRFQFQFAKFSGDSHSSLNSASFVEPYIFNWNGSEEQLKSGSQYSCYFGCTHCGYCAKLIQLNSWKIPDDYPWNWRFTDN